MKFFYFSLFFFFFFNGKSQTAFTPENILGYKIGTRFTRHEKVVGYFSKLQSAYPKQVKIIPYGQTNEHRELFLTIISSEENFNRIEEIRSKHLANEPTGDVAIVWLSYNVHGNESSGTEAAMQTAFELVSVNNTLLKNTIVIIDPCLNPDGRERYVNYFYQYGTTPVNSNNISADHHESWPSGRSNHYLFDLNRDWAWLTQVESKQRIKVYNRWLPHVHVDFHEQAINEPYYFPPAAEPYHEVITKWQREFQVQIGKNHAKYFDVAGWLYFSKETFDLLYPSYGDTYPTFNGAIGMTYEQGGSGRAGLSVLTNIGDTLTLAERVKHHVTTGISTIEVSADQASRLIKEYQQFVKKKNFKYQNYILSGNSPNLSALLNLMDEHEIVYYQAVPNKMCKGYDFFTSKDINYKITDGDVVISTNQTKGTLVNVLFEPKTTLSDSLTYDITAWSLPYAYGIATIATSQLIEGKTYVKNIKTVNLDTTNYAYLCRWNSLSSAKFLGKLMDNKVNVSFSESSFTMDGQSYESGTLIILRSQNKLMQFDELVKKYALEENVSITSIFSGMVEKGYDMGSPMVKNIPKKKMAVLIGDGNSSLSVGEIWHFFEKEMNQTIYLVKNDDLSSSLSEIGVLLIPEGDYTPYDEIHSWMENGGKLIVLGSSVSNFSNSELYNLKEVINKIDSLQEEVIYENTQRSELSNTVNGAIYRCELDASNPLCFGISEPYFTLRTNPTNYKLTDGNVIKIAKENALIAGFSGVNVKQNQHKALTVGVETIGKGCVVYFVDNPLFRGFWENGKLQILNAIYFLNQ